MNVLPMICIRIWILRWKIILLTKLCRKYWRSDIVTLHAPYTKENHHLINKENISMIKKGAYLINTARGELVDTEALVWGLKEGIIAGLGSDLLEDEQILKDAPTPKRIGVPTSEMSGKMIKFST